VFHKREDQFLSPHAMTPKRFFFAIPLSNLFIVLSTELKCFDNSVLIVRLLHIAFSCATLYVLLLN
jgi:hypothetical protein